MNRNLLLLLAIVLAVASVVLSVLLKGVFLVLLIPALLAWNGARPKGGR